MFVCSYYHGECSHRTVDNEIGHVANQVGSKANVEKHVEDGENLLPCVLCMQVAIPRRCEGDNRPIHGVCISQPDTPLLEIRNLRSNPSITRHAVMCGQPEIEATRSVNSKQRHLSWSIVMFIWLHHSQFKWSRERDVRKSVWHIASRSSWTGCPSLTWWKWGMHISSSVCLFSIR